MAAVVAMRAMLESIAVPDGYVFLVWLGQSGFALKFPGGEVVVIDPYLSDAVEAQIGWKRLVPRFVGPRDLPPALLLFTHEHLDHFDVDTVAELVGCPEANRTTLAGAAPCLGLVRERKLPAAERLIALVPGDTLRFGCLTVEAVHVEHTPGALGFVLHHEGGRVYHTGDCSPGKAADEAVRLIKPDIMMVAINGKYGNMSPDEASELAALSSARTVVPMHYGMFAENTGSPGQFLRACCDRGIGERVRLFDEGAGGLIPLIPFAPRVVRRFR